MNPLSAWTFHRRRVNRRVGALSTRPGGDHSEENEHVKYASWDNLSKHQPQKIIRVGLFVVLLLLVGCRQGPASTPTPAGETVTVASGVSAPMGDTIRALGTIRPAQTLPLSFGANGPVQEVSVRVGTIVRTGDVLAVMDVTALDLERAHADQQVIYWQAALNSLRAGANPAQIERAETAHAQQVAEAELALQDAQRRLAQAQNQDVDADVISAQAQIAQLEIQLAQARAQSPLAQVTVARVQLDRAQEALAAAQDEYKKALDRPWEPQSIRDALVQEIQRAEWDLEIAQAQFEGAKQALEAHRLGVEALATQHTILQAQLDQALTAREGYSTTLGLLASEVTLAETRLETLRSWTNPLRDPPADVKVAQIEAQLRQSQLAVDQLVWQIERATLHAPFDGVVSAVHVHPGEWVVAGTSVLELVDTSRWYVETRNVSELDIGRIQVGQQAVVEVLALGRAEVKGTVDTISPVAIVQQGDTTYSLSIQLAPTELNVRSGMNAQVTVETE